MTKISRRKLLRLMGGTALGILGSTGFACGAVNLFHTNERSKSTCRPAISGALWWLDSESLAWGTDGWRDELDRQRRIGFDLLWLCGVPQAMASSPDKLTALLDLCAKRKVRVILDTGTTGTWWSPLNIENELSVCIKNIEAIGKRYAGHSAFYAWYIPHEIYACWGEMADYIQKLYTCLVKACKRTADLPVTLSPFFITDKDKVFGDFRYCEPEEYTRYWTNLIKLSGIDIIMLQDSGEHISFVTENERHAFFGAMQKACKLAGAKFWGNVECAELYCPSKQEYLRLYGNIDTNSAKNAPWGPVPIDRMKQKLQIASEYSEEIVTWGYREYCRPSLGKDAAKWYEDYKAYQASLR